MMFTAFAKAAALQASPDFKGIKTIQQQLGFLAVAPFKPALISKGLRHPARLVLYGRKGASSQP